METNPVAIFPVGSYFDRAISKIFRFDLSRTDVLKWVGFTKSLLSLFFLSIVSVALLLSILSVQQAKRLLEESLSARGEAVAKAVARASFVPLMLEDTEALANIVNVYGTEDDLAYLRIKDAQDRVLIEYDSSKQFNQRNVVNLSCPVVPVLEPGDVQPLPSGKAGNVEVGMSAYRIVRTSRLIAAINIGASTLLVVGVFLFGMRLIGNLTERMRELVGEARLTEELRRANKEMESFSYSVSHDLRTPLRSIDGFSQVLLEDYHDKLDAEGQGCLNRIRAASQRMAELIDAMLGLSRLSRRDLRHEKVDLSSLAKEIAEELQKTAPDRRVDWVLSRNASVTGDQVLLRNVLENLLGNAWKFTSQKTDARIEFGTDGFDHGKKVYFVRDNGAGFDMKYAGKLFGVFQRLHVGAEFPGIGIGLATVQRILQRHEGRIWAESAEGKGATFYFTV